MSAALMDGKALAAKVEEELKLRVACLREKGVTPGLCVILVEGDPASERYVRNKERFCQRVGIRSFSIRLPGNIGQQPLEGVIRDAARNPEIHGILVQLPLPAGLDTDAVLDCIPPEKDVDGFHDISIGRLAKGKKGFVACTPKGILRMLREAEIPLEGKNAVVIGRSNIVGKPVAMLLTAANATVTLCHSRTRNLAELTRSADILVVAMNQRGFVTADMVKPGVAVVDVGIHVTENGLCGDVDFAGVSRIAGAISPVPGGVGPMTVAMLMENTVEAAERSLTRP